MNDITAMKSDMVKEIAVLLMEKDKNLTMDRALSILFNSDTYTKIMDDRTNLYFQSPRYVFSFLQTELSMLSPMFF